MTDQPPQPQEIDVALLLEPLDPTLRGLLVERYNLRQQNAELGRLLAAQQAPAAQPAQPPESGE